MAAALILGIVSATVIARPLIAQAPGQSELPPRDAAPIARRDTAALVLQNRLIAVFRTPLGAVSPQERADAAARRITALVDAETADSVEVRPIPEGVLITVGGRGVFTLTPADADTLTG